MLKVRYFRVRLPGTLVEFAEAAANKQNQKSSSKIQILRRSNNEVTLSYTIVRFVSIRHYLNDGSEVVESTPTMDQHSMRLFQIANMTYLSSIDPPRGSKIIIELFDEVLEGMNYFVEPLELTAPLIEKHVANFDSARLVSAKVSDFEVYDGAIGRLEIASQAGLQAGIAPFLTNKFHRIDALTYEVTYRLTHGLIYYTRNGTVKVSDSLVDRAIPLFESCLQ